MNVLVIGSNGQLATEFRNSLNTKKFKFIFLSKEKLNIKSYKELLSKVNKHKVSIIINCAAYTDVDNAERKRRAAYALNCKGIENLAKICKSKKIYLIHFSTDYVFNGNKKNYKETDKTNPINYYGETKVAGEKIIKNNLNYFVIFRLSWLIGNYSNNFLKSIYFNIKKNKRISMVNDQISNPTTTILVSKVVNICCENFYDNKNILKGIFHLANEPSISRLDFTKFIYHKARRLKLINHRCEIVGISSKNFKNAAKRPTNSSFDLTKIKTKININNLDWKRNMKSILVNFNE